MKIGVYTFHESKEPKDMENEIKKLKKQLEIAVGGLEMVRNLWLENNPMYRYIAMCAGRITKVALEKIKELEK